MAFNRYIYDEAKIGRLLKLVGVLLFVLFLSWALSGCATRYSFIIHPDKTVEAKSSSFREFAYFKMGYNPQTHFFEVVAVGVTDDTAEVVQAAITVGGTIGSSIVPLLSEKQAIEYMLRRDTSVP